LHSHRYALRQPAIFKRSFGRPERTSCDGLAEQLEQHGNGIRKRAIKRRTKYSDALGALQSERRRFASIETALKRVARRQPMRCRIFTDEVRAIRESVEQTADLQQLRAQVRAQLKRSASKRNCRTSTG
jgi:hypothetical protein